MSTTAKEEYVDLSSDIELIYQLVRKNYPNIAIVRKQIVNFVERISKEDVFAPAWVRRLIEKNRTIILNQLGSKAHLFCRALLKLACYLFDLRLIVHTGGEHEQQPIEFGDISRQPYEVSLGPKSYRLSINPVLKVQEGILYRFVNHNELELYKATRYNDILCPKNNTLVPNVNSYKNDHRDCRRKGRQIDKLYTKRLLVISSLANKVSKSRGANSLQGEPRPVYSNYKEVSKRITHEAQSRNYNPEDNNEDPRPVVAHSAIPVSNWRPPKVNKIQSSVIIKAFTDFDDLCLNYSFDDGLSAAHETGFNEAIDFITNYQRRFRLSQLEGSLMKPSRQTATLQPGTFIQGKLKCYSKDKNYGFIRAHHGKDIFLHRNDLEESHIDSSRFENCFRYFEMLLRFRLLQYERRRRPSSKAVKIEILNFIPRQ